MERQTVPYFREVRQPGAMFCNDPFRPSFFLIHRAKWPIPVITVVVVVVAALWPMTTGQEVRESEMDRYKTLGLSSTEIPQ